MSPVEVTTQLPLMTVSASGEVNLVFVVVELVDDKGAPEGWVNLVGERSAAFWEYLVVDPVFTFTSFLGGG